MVAAQSAARAEAEAAALARAARAEAEAAAARSGAERAAAEHRATRLAADNAAISAVLRSYDEEVRCLYDSIVYYSAVRRCGVYTIV